MLSRTAPAGVQTDPVPNPRCQAKRTARWTLRLTGLLAVTAYVLLAPGLAHAAGSDESTPLYDVSVTVARDGTTHINERITYDFANNPHHGIYRVIPVVYDYPPKPGYDRVLEVSNIKVSSGAPHDVKTERDGRNLTIRIGDPHKTVTGKHLYILNYDVKGALNRFDGHVQLHWNALGTAWEVPVSQGQRRRAVPGSRDERRLLPWTCRVPRCPATPQQSRPAWSTQRQANLARLRGCDRFRRCARGLLGTAAADPILKERWSVRKAFTVDPMTVGGGGLVAALGLGGVAFLVLRKGRDKQYVGENPRSRSRRRCRHG